MLSASVDSNSLAQVPSIEDYMDSEEKNGDPHQIRLSRTASNTSLAARAYTEEEGRMHRLGQGIRREVLKPTGVTDYAHGTREDGPPEPEHLAVLRSRFEELRGEEIRERVERDGVDKVLEEIGANAQELAQLQDEDTEAFEAFKNAQLAAAINSGRMVNGTEAKV